MVSCGWATTLRLKVFAVENINPYGRAYGRYGKYGRDGEYPVLGS